MKNFTFLLLSILVTSSVLGVTLSPVLVGKDQVRFEKYMVAVVETEKVINSEDFKSAIYEKEYSYTKKSSSDIFASIYNAEEILKPGKDGVWNWNVGFYYKKGTKVIGWTDKTTMTVWVNTAKFDKMKPWEIADNIAHEYMHKIGHDHKNASDYRSVPYAIGYIVEELVMLNMTKVETPELPPVTAPAPRKSFWQKVKNFFSF